MTFSEERDPDRFPDATAASGQGNASAPSSSESQGRRSPPPLPEEGPGPSEESAEDWLEDEEAQNDGKASAAPLARRTLPAEEAKERATPGREAAAGSSRAADRVRGTASSRPSSAGQALVPRRLVSSNRGFEGSARSSAYAGSYRGDYGSTSSYGGRGGYGGEAAAADLQGGSPPRI
jgi:hypothetical protein